jgi:hypothetical protein
MKKNEIEKRRETGRTFYEQGDGWEPRRRSLARWRWITRRSAAADA